MASHDASNPVHRSGTPPALLLAAVESANDAIIITDARLDPPGPRIVYVNPAFTRMTGYAPGEVLGRSPRILQGPRTDRSVLDRLREDLRTRQEFIGEAINYRKDGSEYAVEWRITPVRDPSGRLTHWVAVQRDVTERRRDERALRASEEQLRLIIDSAAEHAIFTLDLDGRVSSWNSGAQRILGWTEEEILGRSGEIFWTPEDRAADQPRREQEKAAREGRAEDDRPHLRRDGSRFFASGVMTPMRDHAGRLVGFVKVLRDDTERRRALEERIDRELRLAAFTEALPQFAWAFGPDGSHEYVNARWTAYSGLDLDATVRAGRAGFCHPEDVPAIEDFWRRALATGQPQEVEIRYRAADGSHRWFLSRVAPIRNAAGVVVRWAGTSADIHARKLLEERLRFLDLLETSVRPLSDPAEIMANVAALLGEHLDASRCGYAEVEPDGDRFTIPRDWTNGCPSSAGSYRLDLFGPRTTRDLRGGRTLVIRDVDRELSTDRADAGAAMFNAIGVKAAVCCPLVKSGRLAAMMAVHQTVPRPWTEDEVALIRTVADRCWAYIERARAENEVRESRERLDAVFSQATAGIVQADRAGRFTLVNDRFCDLAGRPRDEILRRSFLDLAHPDDLEQTRRLFRRLLRTGEGFVIEHRLRRPDASLLWVSSSVSAIRDRAGRPAAVVAVVVDVTERRRAADALRESMTKFQNLADNIAQFAWMADGSGSVFWYNKRFLEYTGVTAEELRGSGWRRLHHPAHVDRVAERFERSLRTGEIWEDTFPIRGRDGQFRWFLSRALPIRDEAGRVLRWFGTNTDITDQRRLLEEREVILQNERSARADAERSTRLKDEFIATLSHELRTPLNAIIGWSRILRTRRDDAQTAAQAIEIIERNARLQAQLVEDLLDMSRIVSGRLRLEVRSADLPGVLEAAITALRPAADAKGVAIRARVEPDVPPVAGDPDRLQQIAWNLLANAVKFTGGGGSVTAAVRRADRDVELEIADTGIGIAPDFLPHVFDRFRQHDAATTRRHGGLGLGLSIVKSLVELHGGSIEASSPGEGHGAVFRVRIPAAVLPSAAPASSRPDEAPPDLGGVRVLVVDDEPDARSLVRRILEDRGAAVHAAASADEALDAIRARPCDVLVSDIGMPGRDGLDLIRAIREGAVPGAEHVPAAALTALARAEDRRRVLHAGYQHHVPKPVDADELLSVVAALARRSP